MSPPWSFLVLVLAGLSLQAAQVNSLPAPVSGASTSSSGTFTDPAINSDDEHGVVEGDYASARAAGRTQQFLRGDSMRHFHFKPHEIGILADQGDVTHLWTFNYPQVAVQHGQVQRALSFRSANPGPEQSTPPVQGNMLQHGQQTSLGSIKDPNVLPSSSLWQLQPGLEQSQSVQMKPASPEAGLKHFTTAYEQWRGARDETPLTLAERHAIAKAQWQTAYHSLMNDDSHWLNSASLVPSQQPPSVHQKPSHQEPSHQEPSPGHENTELPGSLNVANVLQDPLAVPPGLPYSAIDESQHKYWEEHGAVAADNFWRPPAVRTPLQARLEHFSFPYKSELLLPRAVGKARFYGVVDKGSSNMGLLRYASVPDLAGRLSLTRLSGQRLLAFRDVWKRLGLRMMFAQTPGVAYGVADAQMVKGFFPRLSPEDQMKLYDGSIALIQVEKIGREYFYRLFSVLDPALFRQLRI